MVGPSGLSSKADIVNGGMRSVAFVDCVKVVVFILVSSGGGTVTFGGIYV